MGSVRSSIHSSYPFIHSFFFLLPFFLSFSPPSARPRFCSFFRASIRSFERPSFLHSFLPFVLQSFLPIVLQSFLFFVRPSVLSSFLPSLPPFPSPSVNPCIRQLPAAPPRTIHLRLSKWTVRRPFFPAQYPHRDAQVTDDDVTEGGGGGGGRGGDPPIMFAVS